MRRIVEFLTSFRAPWLLAIGAAVCMSFFAVWWGSLNQDEGWYLYAAQLVHDGKLPYRDFFFTQGPTMPFVYSVLSPIWWSVGSPLQGLLGGRVVTLLFGFAAILTSIALVRHLVPAERRGLAGLTVFAMLGCNLYHLYFTTIPKTYALGGLFVMVGFLLLARGLTSKVPICYLFAAGLSLAFASGTRISLILILPVVGLLLLARFRVFRWGFLWFGLGGAVGLFLTYGLFALDPPSLRTLLAAQSYHAARGGFDPFFALGSVSRLLRGYAALGVIGVAVPFLAHGACTPPAAAAAEDEATRLTTWALVCGFAAVFLLQLSAPFPYDDYQVPIMGLLTVVISAWFARSHAIESTSCPRAAWFVVLVACGISFVSPLLQEWATFAQDRFWSQKKEMTELAKLREIGREIDCLDPGGKTLLTQDLYLAVETGRTVPPGLEMGPFCYFPDWPTDKARALHVMNRELMTELLESAPCPLAACSGYAFAVMAPSCRETPFDEQKNFFSSLKKNYELADTAAKFGQNATTLILLKRREGAK